MKALKLLLVSVLLTAGLSLTACNDKPSNNENIQEEPKKEEQYYSVTYDSKGHGTNPSSLNNVSKLPDVLPTLSESGFTFDGWYYDDDFTKKANGSDSINSNVTLYAKWVIVDALAEKRIAGKNEIEQYMNEMLAEYQKQDDGTVAQALEAGKKGIELAEDEFILSLEILAAKDAILNAILEIMITSKDGKTTIFLAGDSTVKKYSDSTFIGGWGQFLPGFIDTTTIPVVNCAEGGRSSRSFINEGRLFYNPHQTQFKGTSIEQQIEEGDYLFIQFGHNDDESKKQSSYQTMYDRMVPLGTPENGIYPITEGEKVSTTKLPIEYQNLASDAEEAAALNALKKLGKEYYSYDSKGTYKWYLKQYIDFARSVKATPVLVTPVARVKFDENGNIIGGPGLHGENFAYVEAVRQLADETDCLLIDLFDETKTLLETTTKEYANHLMALKPNTLEGTWPYDYDMTYNNSSLGYTGIEATHYNKYGAYLTAAALVENLLSLNPTSTTNELINFKSSLKTSGYYIDPSNNLPKSTVEAIEGLFTTVDVSTEKSYAEPQTVTTLLNELSLMTVTYENYPLVEEKIVEVMQQYFKVNIDDRVSITGYDEIINTKNAEIEQVIIDNRPIATRKFELIAGNCGLTVASEISENMVLSTDEAAFKLYASPSKVMKYNTGSTSVKIINEQKEFTGAFNLNGSSSDAGRYIEFTTTGNCSVTVVAQSSSKDTARVIQIDGNPSLIGDAPLSAAVTTFELGAGTHKLASTSGGIYIYYILIEYFD